jgi:PAS domain S-box-containing protein
MNKGDKQVKELGKSEERFRELADMLPQTIFELDLDANFTYSNRSGFESTGYTQKDIDNGLNALQLFIPEDRERVAKNIARILEGGKLEPSEYTALRKDGSTFPVLIYTRPIIRDGKLEGLRGVVVNISDRKAIEETQQEAKKKLEERVEERTAELTIANRKLKEQMNNLKRTEKALRETTDYLRNLIEHANAPIIVWDREFLITRFNHAFERLTQKSADEVLGKPLNILLPENGREEAMAHIRRAMTGERWEVLEIPIQRTNGEIKTVLWNSATILDTDKKTMIATIAQGQDITERKQAEEALRKSEEKYRQLVQDANSIILRWDRQGKITFFNEHAQKFFGYSEKEIIGKHVVGTIVPETETTGRDLKPLMDDICNHPEKYTYNVNENMRKNGDLVWVAWTNKVIKDKKGNLIEILSVGSDITERKRAEDIIRAQHDLALRLSTAVGLEETLRLCVEATIKGTGMDAGGIYLIDEVSGDLNLVFSKGLSPDFVKAISHYNADTSSARLIMVGQPVYADYLKLDVPLDAIRRREGLHVIAILPINHEGRVIACLNISSRSLDEIPTTIRNTLETMAAQIGSFVARAQAVEALKKSEVKYRGLFENMLEGVYQTRSDGKLLSVNPALVKMLGYESEDELYSVKLAENLYADSKEREKLVQKLEKEGQLRNVEFVLKRKDDREITVMENAQVIYDQFGEISHYEGVLTDITERKRAEEQLKLLSSAVEQSTEGMALSDLQGNVIFINEAFARMHGYTAEEVVGKNLSIFHTPEQMKSVKAANKKILKTGEFIGEIWHVRRNGDVFPTVMHNTLLHDNSGKEIGMIGTMRDITEQKRADKALRDAHEQLNATFDALPDLLFEIDRKGYIYNFHAPHPELLYRPPEEFLGKRVDQCLPKDVSKTIMESIKETSKKGRSRGKIYSLEISGETRWFELSIAATGDLKLPNTHFIAVAHDFTVRKQNVDMIKQKTEELEIERKALTEKNIALKEVLKHIEKERQDYKQQICRDVKQVVSPVLKRLKQKIGSDKIRSVEALENDLMAMLAKDIDVFKGRYDKLTSRESEICEMIKNGMSSKQISEQLNLSILTVQKHREQIRRKLGITNKGVNLATYLRSH